MPATTMITESQNVNLAAFSGETVFYTTGNPQWLKTWKNSMANNVW